MQRLESGTIDIASTGARPYSVHLLKGLHKRIKRLDEFSNSILF